ncbi:hypothetical protein CALVIDRAFT_98241 [Calocera viscosa TUFC12733]|uniref:Uncharacterized protein n=1 Tax=Calocera viscosa (strain TUFC12733) TaxID=1330018 RepID=A0A167MK37_CALVF|nr:hypothetical protein CALVIDRAFT_98241 [Calocera viscosa TUFC12733]
MSTVSTTGLWPFRALLQALVNIFNRETPIGAYLLHQSPAISTSTMSTSKSYQLSDSGMLTPAYVRLFVCVAGLSLIVSAALDARRRALQYSFLIRQLEAGYTFARRRRRRPRTRYVTLSFSVAHS